MSKPVKRYDCNGIECSADYSHMRFVLASDYDVLAQRCRELEADNARLARFNTNNSKLLVDSMSACGSERDTLRAEVERLRALLKQASAILRRDYQDEEALARKIDKEIAAWNARTTGYTPAA